MEIIITHKCNIYRVQKKYNKIKNRQDNNIHCWAFIYTDNKHYELLLVFFLICKMQIILQMVE